MTINIKNPIAELRVTTGYTVEQLSLISGLTEMEITKLESGELVDSGKLARLLAVGSNRQN
ncbi:XRE family transcriptional regulator [Shinella sp. S4-D37]|uniref:XRE family transcriptional regulator n=1 Tax=Shinella sp. S4-D37 TaxID=3161999 RepID=UPI00346772FB